MCREGQITILFIVLLKMTVGGKNSTFLFKVSKGLFVTVVFGATLSHCVSNQFRIVPAQLMGSRPCLLPPAQMNTHGRVVLEGWGGPVQRRRLSPLLSGGFWFPAP